MLARAQKISICTRNMARSMGLDIMPRGKKKNKLTSRRTDALSASRCACTTTAPNAAPTFRQAKASDHANATHPAVREIQVVQVWSDTSIEKEDVTDIEAVVAPVALNASFKGASGVLLSRHMELGLSGSAVK